MSVNSEWTSYESRSIDVKEHICRLIDKINASQGTAYRAETVYEDNEWGVFESSYLYRAITEMLREKTLWDKATVIEKLPSDSRDVPPEQTAFTDEGDELELESPDVITRALNWFKSAAPEKNIREMAKDEYEQRLVALYVEHVESTGETFYPELQAILENEYDFHGDT
jgi:hypothetical protein